MDKYILYSDIKTKDTCLELWGASTKHPDCYFSMNWHCENGKFKKNTLWQDNMFDLYQWLLYIASCVTFPFTAKELVELASEIDC